MGAQLAYQQHLEIETCITCGVTFTLPVELLRRRKRDHQNFFCPNGHPQMYPAETEEDRLRKLLDQANQRSTELTAENTRLAAAKNKLAKEMKKEHQRVAGGVCPCCNRTFIALGRHMATKHPDYSAKK